jgi:XTP/dITP diphosphohydrolase
MKKLLYATNNPGKIFEVKKYLQPFAVELVSPQELSINIEVDEAGKTLAENATLKAKAYLRVVKNMVVMADDTGVEIDALNGEPGIHVRRWRDKKTHMSDQAVINYCLKRMQAIPQAKRGAQFRTVIALGTNPDNIELFSGVLRGRISSKPIALKIPGFPFESIFFIPQWKMMLGEVHQLEGEQKQKYLTHRELAISHALARIKKLISS